MISMKNPTIQINKHQLDYSGIRHYLITHSFIGWLVAEKIRSKHHISKDMTSMQWLHRLLTDHWDLYEKYHQDFGQGNIAEMGSAFAFVIQDAIEKQILPEIPRIAKILHMDEKLLRIFILYDNVPFKINGPQLIHYASPLSPITEMGSYLKVNIQTTIKDLEKALKTIKLHDSMVSELKDTKGLVELRRKQIAPNDAGKIDGYLKIEQKMIELFRAKDDKNPIVDYSEYGNTLVSPAMEMVAGDTLTNEDANDELFDKMEAELRERLNEDYRAITKRYSLPTSKDKTAILRLITS
jgi:hypothetical protein